MSRLTRNIIVNLATNVWSALLIFIATPLFVRFLGVESYGLIGFYLSLLAIIGILDTGISATAVREIAWLAAREDEKCKIPTLLWSLEVVYWGAILILGSLIIVWAWFIGGNWFHSKELSFDQLRTALMLMAVSLVVQVPSGLYLGGLVGLQRQVEASRIMAFFSTLRVVGALMVLWLVGPDIRYFFIWQIVASVLQTGGMRWALWRQLYRERMGTRFSTAAIMSIRGVAVGITIITALSLVMSQADKMLLSRLVPLDVLGYYMLAWTVASGLSRVVTPLMQAYGPHFTELISRGREKEIAVKIRLASQLVNVLILPPAIILILLAEPILYAWTGNQAVAFATAPILMVVTVGTVLSSCAFPAMSLLYGRKLIRPVLVLNILAAIILMPLLVIAVFRYGGMGAACFWAAYGAFLYIGTQTLGLRTFNNDSVMKPIVRDLVAPCVAAFAIILPITRLFDEIESTIHLVVFLASLLLASWLVAMLAAGSLRQVAIERLGWRIRINR